MKTLTGSYRAWLTRHSLRPATRAFSPWVARVGLDCLDLAAPGALAAYVYRSWLDFGSPGPSQWWIFEPPRAPQEDVFRRFYCLQGRCRQKTSMLENLEKTKKNIGFCDVLQDGPQEEVEASCYDLLLLTYLGAVLTSLGLS